MNKGYYITGMILIAISMGNILITDRCVLAENKNGYVNNDFYQNGVLGNGYLNDGHNWYLFKDGKKQTEIQRWYGHYYYFDVTTGLRQNNVFKNQWGNTYYFNGDGVAVSGLQNISGNKYYFGEDNTHYLRKNQWLKINGKSYYANSEGVLLAGIQKIKDKYYYFDLKTNQLADMRNYVLSQWGKWYLIDNAGVVQSGLQRWHENYYYFDPITYQKVTNQSIFIGKDKWSFDSEGVGHKHEENDATLQALNKVRLANGCNPLVWDKELAGLATVRANFTNVHGIPADHWRTAGEVIGIGWHKGHSIIKAWYNETNMLPVGTKGHYNWIIKKDATKVGFGYAGNVIVGIAQ
ncbi:CAP domain-containing protein [Weissella bombi]|uniref:Putative cell wall binding repeat-containing protein n=1 Tax=Weissella bombi TaxID=1505725 RepID=A0A1C3Z6V6_9LACO|nr:CAP domain-containing protein [Weissella bombi]SCB78147.1 Putative cell wall binding repeat-containing protein [Weissella bombi]